MVQSIKENTIEKGKVLNFPNLTIKLTQEKLPRRQSLLDVISFSGKVDNENDYKLNREIHNHLTKLKYDMVIDLAELKYANSVGISVLFSILYFQKEKERKVVIGGTHPFIREIFQLIIPLPVGISVFETLEAAKKALET